MADQVDDFLEHFGIKGMHWGVRKAQDATGDSTGNSNQKTSMSKGKKAAIILGSALGAAAIGAGAIYAKKHFGVSTSGLSKPSPSTKKFVEKVIHEEPTSVLHASRGKHTGFRFLQNGGLTDPLHEFESAFGKNDSGHEPMFKRFGTRSEKIAVRFADPEHRKDAAGRPIFHEVILPEEHAQKIGTEMQAVRKAWQLVRKEYDAHWQQSLQPKF